MYSEFKRQDSAINEPPPKYEPDYNAAVSLLHYMTREQLEEYLNSTDKLDSIIADLPQVKGMKRDQENQVVKNRSLAEYNLGLQPKFDSLKRDVATVYEEVNAVKMSLGEDVAKLESCSGAQSHDTMLAIFQTEAATTDEQSEDIAEKFCDGELDIDTFLSDYIPKRTLAYEQRAKVDKMAELIRQGTPMSTSGAPYPPPTGGVTGGMNAMSYGQPPHNYGNHPTPYAPQPYGMPTPQYPR